MKLNLKQERIMNYVMIISESRHNPLLEREQYGISINSKSRKLWTQFTDS